MKIGGIIEQRQLALYTIASIKDKPGSAADVLHVFAEENINLAYITEASNKEGNAVLSFCVDCDDKCKIDAVIKNKTKVSSVNIQKVENVGLIGVYGPHFREKPAIAVKLFSVLGKAEINILGISSSISTISCIVDIQELDRAREALLDYFELP